MVKYAKHFPKKSEIVVLVLNQSPISAVFPIVQFAGDQKNALNGESLYYLGSFTPFLLVNHLFERKRSEIHEMAIDFESLTYKSTTKKSKQ